MNRNIVTVRGLASGLFASIAAGIVLPGKIADIRLARKKSEDPTVYVELDADNLSVTSLREHGLTETSISTLGEEYTGLSFANHDAHTGIEGICTDLNAASLNPNFERFVGEFLAKNFDKEGSVIGANGKDVNLIGRVDGQRSYYVMRGHKTYAVRMPLDRGQFFTTTAGLLGFVPAGSTEVMTARFQEINEQIERGNIDNGIVCGVKWEIIGSLANPVVAIARSDFAKDVVLFTLKDAKGELSLVPYTISVKEIGDLATFSMKPAYETIQYAGRRIFGLAANRTDLVDADDTDGKVAYGTRDNNEKLTAFFDAPWAKPEHASHA